MSRGTGLPGLSVRRPWLATVLNLLIVIAGVGALFGLEVRELPDVERPVVSVDARYPGASPTTVDAELASVVEGAVARVAGVVAVRTSSEENNFRMSVEFRPDRDLAAAANDVREAVSRVGEELPEGVRDLFVVKADEDADPVMSVAVWSDRDPIDALTRRVEDAVVPEFTAVDGVAQVTVDGARQRTLRVEVSPARLAAYGLTVAEVADVLERAQFDVPVGSFEADGLRVLVRADATVARPEAIEELTVREPVRLGDVADVWFAPAEPESVARVDGRVTITLGVVRQAGANTVAIADAVRACLETLRGRFPEFGFAVVENDAVFIRGAVGEAIGTLAMAVLIVVGIIWLFIGRLRATLAPAAAIPVALIGSLAAIWALGFSLNLVTLLALVLATGLVVDDAIVVLENVQRRRADGLGPLAAATIGAEQVFFAVLATSATLMAVFVPISFLPGDAGRLFSEFGFTLAATVLVSSFTALTLCPMIASRTPDLGGEGGPLQALGDRLAALYAALLRPALAAPLVTVTLATLLAGSAALVYGDLGQELTPDEDRGRVQVRMQGPDGAGLDHTDRHVAQVEAMMRPWRESGLATSIASITGRYDLNRGEVTARLAPWSERDATQAELEAELRPQLDGLAGVSARLVGASSLDLGGGAGGLEMALTGPAYPDIAEAAFAFADGLEALRGVSGVRVQYQATQPQLSVVVDRRRAADLDVSLDALATTLRALVDEDEIAELTIGDEAVPVVLRSRAGAVRDPSDLLNLYVRAETGELVALSQLVTFSEEGVAAELDRHEQSRAIEIDANLDPSVSLREAVAAARDLARETLPEGVGLIFLGEAASLEETSSALVATYVLALAVVLLVLLAQFESLTSAAVVILTVPFAVCAAVMALWLTGLTVNIFNQIGVLLLIGVMAKNGILLVEFADQLRDRGASALEAAGEAARTRLRPIAMTVSSTMIAALPLVAATGPGAEGRQSIGWVIFGGLGLAAVFTLFVTPALYALIAGLSRPRAAAGEALDAELRAAEAGRSG